MKNLKELLFSMGLSVSQTNEVIKRARNTGREEMSAMMNELKLIKVKLEDK